jgi:uncharacterized protein affecting Mg2+/Co2+ transport
MGQGALGEQPDTKPDTGYLSTIQYIDTAGYMGQGALGEQPETTPDTRYLSTTVY